MESRSYSYTRQHFAEVMDQVNENRDAVLITRQSGKPVVMISLDEFNALEETAYLLRSPANAERLIEAVAALRQGQGRTAELADDAD